MYFPDVKIIATMRGVGRLLAFMNKLFANVVVCPIHKCVHLKITHNIVFCHALLKDKHMDGCSDGSWTDPDGCIHQFFKCPNGRGLYYPLNRLQCDSRFQSHVGKFYINSILSIN